MSESPKVMIHDYRIFFDKKPSSYFLSGYNTPWDNDRELEDLRLIFEGKDLKDNDLPAYKVIDWESLEEGSWDAEVKMTFVLNKDGKSYDQIFQLRSLKKVVGNEQGKG